MIYEIVKYDREDEWSAFGEDDDTEYLKIKMDSYGVDVSELPTVFISGDRYEVYLDADSIDSAIKNAKQLIKKQLQKKEYNEYSAEQHRNYDEAVWGRRG